MPDQSPPNSATNTLIDSSDLIEGVLLEYFGITSDLKARDFIYSYSHEYLQLICPDAIDLPAACIAQEVGDEFFIGIHLSPSIYKAFAERAHIQALFNDTEGMNCLLTLIEEISHFHNILRQLRVNSKVSKFDLELQAEVDKVIVASIICKMKFGKPHVHELISIMFDRSICVGDLTNYKLASKIAEKFLKENISSHGPNIIFDSRFRYALQLAASHKGQRKIELLSHKLHAA